MSDRIVRPFASAVINAVCVGSAVITAVCVGVAGCGPLVAPPVDPIDKTHPAPSLSVEQEARRGMSLYRDRSARAFRTVADEIRSGRIRDDAELADRIEVLTKAARLESFESFRAAWNHHAGPDSTWEPTQRAALAEDSAKGFTR